MKESPTIGDVLAGREALKLEVSFSNLALVSLGVVILVAVAVGVFIGKKA